MDQSGRSRYVDNWPDLAIGAFVYIRVLTTISLGGLEVSWAPSRSRMSQLPGNFFLVFRSYCVEYYVYWGSDVLVCWSLAEWTRWRLQVIFCNESGCVEASVGTTSISNDKFSWLLIWQKTEKKKASPCASDSLQDQVSSCASRGPMGSDLFRVAISKDTKTDKIGNYHPVLAKQK